jgi:hypothetical protein
MPRRKVWSPRYVWKIDSINGGEITLETTTTVIARSASITLALHLIVFLLGFGAFLLLKPEGIVHPNYVALLSSSGLLTSAADPAAIYSRATSSAVGVLQAWWGGAIAASFLASLAWIVSASLKRPTSPQAARYSRTAWFVWFLIGAGLVAGFGIFYLVICKDVDLLGLGVALSLGNKIKPDVLFGLTALIIVCYVFGYYTGTLLGIKKAMRPSVPLSSVFLH